MDQVEHQVAARLARQQLLTQRPNTGFVFVIEQALLERRTGGSQVTGILLDHLLERGRLRNVEIQIMPTRREDHAGLDGPMYLAETQDHQWIGYSEGQQNSSLISAPKT